MAMQLQPIKRKKNKYILTGSKEEKIAERAIELKLNALFIGGGGVGKTSMMYALCHKHELTLGYFSVPNTDVFSDIAGIPITKNGKIHMAYNETLDDYDILFFDEMNRLQHPKMQGAFLELLRDKSINGHKFSKLKMVWGAINPPNDRYLVDELDFTVLDRFHIFIEMPSAPNREYFNNRFGIELTNELLSWWERLSPDKQNMISPRRLEYMCEVAILTDCNEQFIHRTTLPRSINVSDVDVLCIKLRNIINKNGINLKTTTQNMLDRIVEHQTNTSARLIDDT